MTSTTLKKRYLKWVINVIVLLRTLPKSEEYRVIRYQLTKSSSSSGANYNAACRAKSAKDFLNKLKIVEEELDESIFWFDLLEGLGVVNKELNTLKVEANELLSITVASINTTRKKLP